MDENSTAGPSASGKSPARPSSDDGGAGASLVLTYDAHTAAKDPRARWILPGYCVGVMLAGCLYASIYMIVASVKGDSGSFFIDTVALPLGFAMLSLLPSIIALGLCLWVRQRALKEVRFARFRAAVGWGFFGGLYPWTLYVFFQESTDWFAYMALGGLAWFVIVPAVAGTFLCYRSHLRD